MLVKQVEHNLPRQSNSPEVNSALWLLYNTNPDRVILKVGGFIKIRVKDLRFLFELIAGPEI